MFHFTSSPASAWSWQSASSSSFSFDLPLLPPPTTCPSHSSGQPPYYPPPHWIPELPSEMLPVYSSIGSSARFVIVPIWQWCTCESHGEPGGFQAWYACYSNATMAYGPWCCGGGCICNTSKSSRRAEQTQLIPPHMRPCRIRQQNFPPEPNGRRQYTGYSIVSWDQTN